MPPGLSPRTVHHVPDTPPHASSDSTPATASRTGRQPSLGGVALLERSEELGRIDSALVDALHGRGRFVVVEGPAGIGKTAFLTAARTVATGGGLRALRSRGSELERDFAFGVVRQLFEPVLAEATEPERKQLLEGPAGVAVGLLGLPGAQAPASAPPSDLDPSFAVLHGLYWLCANLAAAGPLCIAVDDAHWADAPSLRFLAFLLPRIEELDVALVVATRPHEAGTDAALLAALITDPSADVIRLPPLTRAAVASLAESALHEPPDPAFVDACLRATKGTPFLVQVLVTALDEGRIAPTAENARRVERIGARTVGRSVRLWLRLLPEPADRLARALALLERCELHEAARLAELDDLQAAEAADMLASAGIVEPGRPLAFIHPMVRAGLYEQLSDTERARGHRRAAALLADHVGAGDRVAQHLLVSAPSGDAWVYEQLVEAASAAGRRGAPEAEAVFLRRALAEPPPPGDHSKLLLELGMTEAVAGLEGWSEHLREAMAAAPNAVEAAGAARVLSLVLLRTQRYAEAVEVLDRASAALDTDHAELALRIEAESVLAAMIDPETAAATAERRQVLRERAAVDDPALPDVLAVAAFSSVLANEPASVGADLATRAVLGEAQEATDSEALPWFSSATLAWTFALLWAERYEQVRPLLDVLIKDARAVGDGARLALGLTSRAWVALRRGDLDGAEADARTALWTELPAPPLYRVLCSGLLITSLVDQGRLETAEDVLAEIDSEAQRAFLPNALLLFARGRLRVAQGHVTEGLDDFLAVGELLSRALVVSPAYLPWRSEAALAQLVLGERVAAGRLAEHELALAEAFGAPRALGVAKRAAGLVAGGGPGELLLREAVESFELAGAMLERARALADLGALLRRNNRRVEARELLREAMDAAHRAGATPVAERAETELRATGARPRRILLTGLDSLTASERRIAELAGQGMTNREIAQALFITARTVEGHLTSVFRKLEIDSRDQLAATLEVGVEASA